MSFFHLEQNYQNRPIAMDENGKCYGLEEFLALEQNVKAWIPTRSLVFLFAENTWEAMAAYCAFLRNGIVPVMMSNQIKSDALQELLKSYRPDFLVLRKGSYDFSEYQLIGSLGEYAVLQTEYGDSPALFSDLAMLLTTSGSTGSPKLVRQSYRNINANAQSIAEYLQLTAEERPITSLPFHYTYGISVINSHLLVGATILLTDKSVVEKEFWAFMRGRRATSFAGVPYTYQLLNQFRFFKMDLPALKTLTQAGGKLSVELHRKFAEYADRQQKRFLVMYGQTEATARMAYLPAEMALQKIGAMGIAIPGGRFELIDATGQVIKNSEEVGELVYYGENVTLGYAEKREDLSKGDERRGRLETGDMAKRDEEGYYTIVGRKKRFLKIFGNRINLDEVERNCHSHFSGFEFACAGEDDKMLIYYVGKQTEAEIRNFLVEMTGFHPSAFRVIATTEIPKNEAGKVQYALLSGLETDKD